MIAEGQPAPDFTLHDQDGNEVTLSKFQGSPIVLYFYPKKVSFDRRSVRWADRKS